ncbi:MAG: hypothetical protein OXG38_03315 [Chloroflexi bacterium]|nr:hypothetical protein [Chloroflexota bacterium]
MPNVLSATQVLSLLEALGFEASQRPFGPITYRRRDQTAARRYYVLRVDDEDQITAAALRDHLVIQAGLPRDRIDKALRGLGG